MRLVAKSWETIEGVLWEHSHSVFRSLRPPATARQVASLEETIAAALPEPLARSLRIHDGLRRSYLGPVRLFDYMALLPASAIARVWRDRCKVHGSDDPGGCQMTTDRRIRNDRWWRPGWLPFMDADGDMLLLDTDPGPGGSAGQVFKFSNSGARPRQVIAGSLTEWLSLLADELLARRFDLDERGGIWLRNRGLS